LTGQRADRRGFNFGLSDITVAQQVAHAAQTVGWFFEEPSVPNVSTWTSKRPRGDDSGLTAAAREMLDKSFAK
jgi:hypothetical protein